MKAVNVTSVYDILTKTDLNLREALLHSSSNPNFFYSVTETFVKYKYLDQIHQNKYESITYRPYKPQQS